MYSKYLLVKNLLILKGDYYDDRDFETYTLFFRLTNFEVYESMTTEMAERYSALREKHG